jgi:uncharacterized protein YwgA
MKLKVLSQNLESASGLFEPKVAGDIFELADEGKCKEMIELGYVIEIKADERPVKESKGSVLDSPK